MTLYELIMSGVNRLFTRQDWSMLGKGEIDDQETIEKMLMEGYEAIANED